MELAKELRETTRKIKEEQAAKTKKECDGIIPKIEDIMRQRAAQGKDYIYIQFSPFDEGITNNPLETGVIIFRRKDVTDVVFAENYLREYFLANKFDVMKTLNELYVRW